MSVKTASGAAAMSLSVAPRRNLSPSSIIFGGIWIGPGGGPNGDGDRPDRGQANADATVLAAVDAGVRELDTAPWYGSGACEERMGRAVRSMRTSPNVDVDSLRVTTKVGRLVYHRRRPGDDDADRPVLGGLDDDDDDGECGPEDRRLRRVVRNDYSASGARLGLSHSLSRMGLDRVHCLRIHDPNDNSLNRVAHGGTGERRPPGLSVDEVEEALDPERGMLAELRRLRDGGVIDSVGLGMNCNEDRHMGAPGQALRLLRSAPRGTFDSAMLAGGWNLMNQDGRGCYAECQARGIDVHGAGVFASGLLAYTPPHTSSGDGSFGCDSGDCRGDEGNDGCGVVGEESTTPQPRYAYRTAERDEVERARGWRDLASRHGLSLPAVAIAFAALPRCVTRLCLGLALPRQVEETLGWVDQSNRVPVGIWGEAKALGLLDDGVPTP